MSSLQLIDEADQEQAFGPPVPLQLSATRDFYSLSYEELETLLHAELGLPSFRATQLFDWVYRKRVTDFSRMLNIAKPLREKLARLFTFPQCSIAERSISIDGTRKYLFQLEDGQLVESVMIKQPKRMTLCVSSQVGCAMGCSFCRTATMGLRRQLKPSEIVQQVLGVIDDAKNFGDSFSNMVFMGMGEPLHNIAGIGGALRTITDPRGMAFPGRKVTVSTVGLVNGIRKFFDLDLGVNLAVSLNATTDEVRSRIMPVNKRFPIHELLGALRELKLKRGRRVTIEYVMLKGINDSQADCKRLPGLLKGIPSKVNLIPYNENAGLGFHQPDKATLLAWHQALTDRGIQTNIRWSKGADINAACGQLAVKQESVN